MLKDLINYLSNSLKKFLEEEKKKREKISARERWLSKFKLKELRRIAKDYGIRTEKEKTEFIERKDGFVDFRKRIVPLSYHELIKEIAKKLNDEQYERVMFEDRRRYYGKDRNKNRLA